MNEMKKEVREKCRHTKHTIATEMLRDRERNKTERLNYRH